MRNSALFGISFSIIPISHCAYILPTLAFVWKVREPDLALDSARWVYHSVCSPFEALDATSLGKWETESEIGARVHSFTTIWHRLGEWRFSSPLYTWLAQSDPNDAMWGDPSFCYKCHGGVILSQRRRNAPPNAHSEVPNLNPGETPHQCPTRPTQWWGEWSVCTMKRHEWLM